MKERNNVVFKAALPGEGKTRWLLDIAKCYLEDECKPVYMFTTDDEMYSKFCDKYFKLYNTICQVTRLTNLSDVTEDSVIIIDDLFANPDVRMSDITSIINSCYKMYITLNGWSYM